MKKTLFFLLACSTQCFAQNIYVRQIPNNAVLNDNKMHIYFCGTGVPQVDMQTIRKPACLAVIANNQFFVFDVGDGAVQTLASMGLPYLNIQHIFLTHLHSDHMSGLGEMMNGTWHSGRKIPLTVHGPYGAEKVVNGFRKAYRLDVLFRAIGGAGLLNPDLAFANTIEFSADKNGTKVYEQNGVKISAFAVNHLPVFPAYGYQIAYKGCNIVISGDTNVTDSLATHAKNADLLINETLSNPLYKESVAIDAQTDPSILQHAQQISSYHSDSLLLAKMAQSAQVKNLALTHLLPAIPTTADAKKAFIAGMDQFYKGPITVADDGDELQIFSTGSDCNITYVPAKQPDLPVIRLK